MCSLIWLKLLNVESRLNYDYYGKKEIYKIRGILWMKRLIQPERGRRNHERGEVEGFL